MRILRFFTALIGLFGILLSISEAKAQSVNVPEVYLAGPLGFSESGRAFEDGKITPELTAAGIKVVDPWHLSDSKRLSAVTSLPYGPVRRAEWQKFDEKIGQTNETAIRHSTAIVAVLDGPDVDSGTAAEIGYAYAMHKPIVGYRSDFRLASDNEGSVVNLQVQYFIQASGGSIVSSYTDIPAAVHNAIGTREPGVKKTSGEAPQPNPARNDVIDFYERVFGIVLALALAEAFKQSVSDKRTAAQDNKGERLLDREKIAGLLSFLFLIFPFFQGMNRYFYFMYHSPNALQLPYAGNLIFDGVMFTIESAIFFFMSRALSADRWALFRSYAFILLGTDSTLSFYDWKWRHAPIGAWLGLNIATFAVLGALTLVAKYFPKLSSRLGLSSPWAGSCVFAIRTILDYWVMWSFYFP